MQDIIGYYDNVADELNKLSENIRWKSSNLKRILSKIKRGCSTDNDFIVEHNTTYFTVSEKLFHISNIWRKSCETLPIKRRELDEIDLKIANETGLFDVKREGETVYIRMPLLPLKRYKTNNIHLYNLYQRELRLKLNEAQNTIGLPDMQKKFIRIVHVFKTDTNEDVIPDNDNYDINATINTVTDYIGCGDSVLNCTITLETITLDEIPDGTYIIATPSETLQKNILKNLKRIFAFLGGQNTRKNTEKNRKKSKIFFWGGKSGIF
jgi:hypothetical protein